MKLSNLIIYRNIVKWLKASSNAIEGILYASRTERHLKFHLFSAFCILLFCFVVGLDKIEFIIIVVITLLVIITEMINSAIEKVVDLYSREYNTLSKIVKDIAAGAVLITAAGAIIIGYLVLYPYIKKIFSDGFWIAKHRPENIAVLAVIIVLLVVIFLKTTIKKGEELRGGFPSGHAALSFSIFTSAYYIFENKVLLGFILFLAIIISAQRLTLKMYRIIDVIAGVLIGSLITLGLFWVFH